MRAYATPILVTISNLVGALIVVMGCIAMIGGLSLYGPTGGIACLIVCLIMALPLFGFAQVIGYFARTAYHAQCIDENVLVSMMPVLSQIQKTLSIIAGQIVTTPPSLPSLPVSHTTVNCPHCDAEVAIQTVHRGVNTCVMCGKTFEME
jgi:hypothetical protein